MRKKLINYIKIPKIKDDCDLYFAENQKNIPFEIKRIYYIMRSKPNQPRGFHAHHKTKQVLFCIQGSARIVLDNGNKRKEIKLNKPNVGIFLDRLIWHEMHKLNADTILLIIASEKYDPHDYIREYKKFLEIAKNEAN